MQEILIARGIHVFPERIHNVSVDVVLSRTRCVVRRCLISADGPPGKKRPFLIHLPGPLPGLVEKAESELEQVFGDTRRGIDPEGEYVDLGIPEVVSLIALPGEPLGRDPSVLGSTGRLKELENVKTNSLLHERVTANLYVTPSPEIVHVTPLAGQQLRETMGYRSIQRPLGPFA